MVNIESQTNANDVIINCIGSSAGGSESTYAAEELAQTSEIIRRELEARGLRVSMSAIDDSFHQSSIQVFLDRLALESGSATISGSRPGRDKWSEKAPIEEVADRVFNAVLAVRGEC
jgi:hypothetical protein